MIENEEHSDRKGAAPPLAYSVEEAAKIARLSRSSIYLALRDGSLTARKAGRRTIICPSDLQQFIDGLPLFPGRASAGGE
ncbi:helix-turn-helix domain-containing protein [Qipengyuania flava]|uniref:helix-turn-helix domain-containing protein n=1 Tax=Qipengyuania flava TaxID=192812 RepID=UPI00351713D8